MSIGFDWASARKPYYLIVSALVPYKKINIAIEAFNRLKLPLEVMPGGLIGVLRQPVDQRNRW
jgi:glycosyltransferase involved in cell wall biosynthesis